MLNFSRVVEGNISPEERKFGSGVEAHHQVLCPPYIKEPTGITPLRGYGLIIGRKDGESRLLFSFCCILIMGADREN